MNYLFKSERLGFRNWDEADKAILYQINSDSKVMEFFPNILNLEQTENFIKRMQLQFAKKGYCYFAVDKLETNEFIGFIGVSEQTYQADFTPCVDIGWRLQRREWGKGYATEGAKECLNFAFKTLKLNKIFSICPVANEKSENVMKKIGMTKKYDFKHPLLFDNKKLELCALYEISSL